MLYNDYKNKTRSYKPGFVVIDNALFNIRGNQV
jgi:hypothetical protein